MPAPTAGDDVVEHRVTGVSLAQTFHRDGDFWVSPVVAVEAATVVGAMLELTGGPVEVEARAVDSDNRWIPLRETWREGRLRVARADLETVAARVQIRVPVEAVASLTELIWSPVVPEEREDPVILEATTQSTHALLANFETWDVRPRSAWQARQPSCRRDDELKTRLAVHHTAGSPGQPGAYDAKLRQIQALHMDSNGWCDIGYHFLVSLDGVVWEGRELFDQGAHIQEHNRANIGLSFIGCFHPTSDCAGITPLVPPDDMVAAGGEITGVLAHIFELPIDAATIKGHRDFANTATACPGDNLAARLDDLRAVAAATLTQFEGQCGCDLTNGCDDGCSCDVQCENDDGGCTAAAGSPLALLGLLGLFRRRRSG